ncbi:hypothetical protein BDV93DRAFT_513039 [Ceratobasidium sp. AG-I]|nr:hypothetical protein BDV93DRAFT_513039 [Ceratobasidium sp. AG-I]
MASMVGMRLSPTEMDPLEDFCREITEGYELTKKRIFGNKTTKWRLKVNVEETYSVCQPGSGAQRRRTSAPSPSRGNFKCGCIFGGLVYKALVDSRMIYVIAMAAPAFLSAMICEVLLAYDHGPACGEIVGQQTNSILGVVSRLFGQCTTSRQVRVQSTQNTAEDITPEQTGRSVRDGAYANLFTAKP